MITAIAETLASEKRKRKEARKSKKNKKMRNKSKTNEVVATGNDTVPDYVDEIKIEEPVSQELLNEKEDKEPTRTDVKKSLKKENKTKKKKKAKSQTEEVEETSVDGANDGREMIDLEKGENQVMPSNDDKNDEDSEDDELLAAAAAWAQHEPLAGATPDRSNDHVTAPAPRSFSLHITQLPFDANDLDIRQLFAEKGCIITSIRLVYDKDEQGRNALFRGVAFVDLLDEASYEIALKLNRSRVRGRKLNIRPTRSKQELADIVTRTQELVKAKIQKQRDGQDDDPVDKVKAKKDKKMDKKKAKKQDKKAKKKDTQAKSKTPRDRKEQEGNDKKDPDRKLTKKERNRRAAIILGLQRKRRK